MRMSKIMLIAALFLISCSEGDNFFDENDEKNYTRISPYFSCDTLKNTMSLHGYIYDVNYKLYNLSYSLENNYLQDFFWIVNGDTIREFAVEKEMPYGEHFVKLFITDIFGDTASFIDSCWIKEPFSINLLSPVDSFSINSPVEFQYEINGKDELKGVFVYASKDKNSLWEEENLWEEEDINKTLEPPYFWGVKAFTEDDTCYSEIRWVQALEN